VKLTDGTLAQMLLGSSDVMAGREVGNNLLPDPTAVEDACLGVREGPFQAGDAAGVGALLAEAVGRLAVSPIVCSACALPLVSNLPVLTYYMVLIAMSKSTSMFALTKDRSALAITTDGLALMKFALVALLKMRHTENTSDEGQGGKAQAGRDSHGDG
jgi:hypothetical protein